MFSETVDTVVNRSKRPDRLVDCINYVNAVIRQLHGLHYFGEDSRELRITPGCHDNYSGIDFNHHVQHHGTLGAATQMFAEPPHGLGLLNPAALDHLQYVGGRSYYSDRSDNVKDKPHVWKHPKELRKLEAVLYDGRNYATFKLPSRQQASFCHYYYRSNDTHVFVGWKQRIDLYYYVFPPYMSYYRPEERLVKFDRPSGEILYRSLNGKDWVVSLGSSVLEGQAYAKSCDWMLERWNELVVTHALAMLYVNLQDPRAAQIQAIAKQLEATMIAAEVNYANGVT